MVEVEATCDRRGDVTLVRGLVTNTRSTPQRIRLRSRLEGPVWTPDGTTIAVPAWDADEGSWAATVRPGRTRGLGFASPAPPVETPIELVGARRTDDEPATSRTAVDDLEAWAPPSDVLSREL